MLIVLLGALAHAGGGGPIFTSEAPGYANRIQDRAYAADYVEVCFKNGFELSDLHVGGGSTAGGNCLPGDTGFVVETVARADETWANALAVCLANGMRLIEPFEIQYTCSNALTLGFAAQTGVKGWVGNRPILDNYSSIQYDSYKAFALENNCNSGTWYATYANWAKPFLCAQ
jgi:hypothetical protein